MVAVGFTTSAFGQNYRARVKPTVYQNGYTNPRFVKLFINSQLLGEVFLQELYRYPEIKLTSRARYPYFFTYLEGSTWAKYSTGNEDGLYEKIVSAPDYSIDPVKLFQWSLELNRGALFESLLTIHEVLRREARFYREWVNHSSSIAEMQAFFNKFVDIRGDLEERGDGFTGDHRGSWYRMWGTMLHYVYMISPKRNVVGSPAEVLGNLKNLGWADVKGKLTSRLAEYAKPIFMYGSEVDDRKIEYNQKGYDIMSSMLHQAKTGDDKISIKNVAPDDYLVPFQTWISHRCKWIYETVRRDP